LSASIGIQIEGQEGLDWARWRALCRDVEALGFDSLWRSDHLVSSMGDGDRNALECWTSLAMAAEWTSRIEFGPLVTPMTFRPPGVVAKMAAAVDNLAGGRLVLGVGAGWHREEHEFASVPFPSTAERLDRLEHGIQVIRRVLAQGRPAPARPMPLLIGGSGEHRTLSIVARYADEWNTYGHTPEEYRRLVGVLDQHCRAVGRDPSTIRRSLMVGFIAGRSRDDLRTRAEEVKKLVSRFANLSADDVLAGVRGRWITGTPEEIVEQLRPYAALGVTRFMLQQFLLDDRNALELLATDVMPALG
jgi:alkanesulfonate monooxygenase SsuD/methylene tetrahydromethanopterin reductase-like flavin-dependent oxidoreductase (luciferase family)